MPRCSRPLPSRLSLLAVLVTLAAAGGALAQDQAMPSDEALAKSMDEARARAREVLGRMDRSAPPAAGAFNARTPADPRRPDPLEVAERMRAQTTGAPQRDAGHDLVALVSFSMPKGSLERLARESARYGAVLVFRGPKDGSLRETLRAFEPLARLGANAVIHPPAFRAHRVTSVPVYLFGRPLASGCEDAGRCEDVLRVDGDVSVRYALERMARAEHPLAAAAQARLDAAGGGR